MSRATSSFFPTISLYIALLTFTQTTVFAAAGETRPRDPCPRPVAGSIVVRPPDLFSRDGVLNLAVDYFTALNDAGRTLFCFRTPDGLMSPTLHVKPGDTLNLSMTNKVLPPPAGSPTELVSDASTKCDDKTMTISSVNVHYHGTNSSPACHHDEAIHTIINSGQTSNTASNFRSISHPGST